MVRLLFRLLALACLIGAAISILLLLNMTAPNPTGRRYSSLPPLTVGDGKQIGASAEWILARDLRLPNNNAADQRQCICGSGRRTPADCNSCVHSLSAMGSSYRIPDFISPHFIAESKNRSNLMYSGREVDQLQDYALAALMLKIPLWVYVRVDTPVAPEFIALVESTGGGVIRYFTTEGFVDPVDRAAWAGLLGSVPLGAAAFYLGFRRPQKRRSRGSPGPVGRANRVLDQADAFAQRVKGRLRQELQNDDTKL
jgi:hypothetical protein